MRKTAKEILCVSLYVAGFMLCNSANVQAQKEFSIGKLSVINVGDGRMLFREYMNETPLSGQCRIIDGYKTEYVLAEFENGFYNGLYQFFKYNKLSEQGAYKEGRREGKWTEYYGDGETVKSERNFIDGKLDGICKTYFPDGKTESEKGYKNGVEHGKEQRYHWENHDKLIVDAYFADGKADGKQVRHISSNRCDYVQTEHYKNGVRNGKYSKILEDGGILEKGTYKDGKKDGVWQENSCDGKPQNTTTYKNGLKNGESKTYYTDGSVEKTLNYADDQKNGLSKEYDYNTGNLKAEFYYKNDKKDGDYKRYDSDKQYLKEEGRYEAGTQVYYKTYSFDGKVLEVKERNAKGVWESK